MLLELSERTKELGVQVVRFPGKVFLARECLSLYNLTSLMSYQCYIAVEVQRVGFLRLEPFLEFACIVRWQAIVPRESHCL